MDGPVALKQRSRAAFLEAEPELRLLSRWMYDNPETALEEHATSQRLASTLAARGFRVEYPAFGMATAFAARAGTSGPEVVICAELDALPDVGHACGHNLIAMSALGAGLALVDLVEDLGCRVTVLGTPAEESHGGKVDLIDAGAFAGAAAAMMVHPATVDVLDPEVLAVVHLHVEFFGKESHAAFAPQVGINALDAAVQAYVNVSTLRQALYATDKVHGVITSGGSVPNVIPAHTAMDWFVRAGTRHRLDELTDRVAACFEAAATATGCRVEWREVGHRHDDLITNEALARLFAANAASLGRILPGRDSIPPGMAGSTDMGNVSHVVPSIHPMLRLEAGGAVNHQADFAAATVTPDGEALLREGALAMAWTVIDLSEGDHWSELQQDARTAGGRD